MYVVHGSYFNNNFGDTLLIKLMCDYVSSIVGKDNVYLATLGNEKEQEAIGYPVIAKEKYHLVTHLIFSGGGYFGEPPRKNLRLIKWYLRNYKRHVAWNKKFKDAKIGAFGVGYGPLSIPFFRDMITSPLKKAEVIFFRDEESIDYFHQYNQISKKVSLATDFALSLEQHNISNSNNTIALHLPKMDVNQVVDVLDIINTSKFSKSKVEFILDGDGKFPNDYINYIHDMKVAKNLNFEITFKDYIGMDELIERLGTYLCVITTKLHVGIVTTALGGKVISIPWHTKTSRFYKQIGLGEFCIQNGTNKQKIGSLLNMLNDYSPDREMIDDSLKTMKDAIRDFVTN